MVWAPSGSEAAAFDRLAIDDRGVPERTLMENAGRSAALLLHQLHPHGTVVAFVGSGNNGGDALVLLRSLQAWGREVRAVLVGRRPADDPLLHGRVVPATSWPDDSGEDPDPATWLLPSGGGVASGGGEGVVLVDGLLGTGISGAPRGRYGAAIEAINRSPWPVLSLDVPSGVDADDGSVPGTAVRASTTVAFGWPKLGTLLHPGRARAGRLLAVEIGFPAPGKERFGVRLMTPAWAAALRPRRPPVTHKNRVGSLLLVAGRPGMAGAAVLAARAALRSGVGLLRVASHPANREIVQGGVPEAIFVDRTDGDALTEAAAASRALAVGSGMGTGEDAGEALRRVAEAAPEAPLLLDADALTLAASEPGPGIRELARRRPVLLTPHPGEMARLTGRPVGEITGAPVEAARAGAGAMRATLLLKGNPSVIAPPQGAVVMECVGSSDLASAGMGDVLTGAAGALLAQGLAPLEAGALALHLTGMGARLAGGGPGFVPSDAVERLPEVLQEPEGEPADRDSEARVRRNRASAHRGEGPTVATSARPPFVIFEQGAPR